LEDFKLTDKLCRVWLPLTIWLALPGPMPGQIPTSAGLYQQNFDALASSGASNPWFDNETLPGWYAAKTLVGTTVSTYRADGGSNNTGALYSFGVAGVNSAADRALGSIASGTPGHFAYGVRFLNDTAVTQTNILVSYTGEQWRNGGNTAAQTLAFFWRVSSSPITDADAVNAAVWTGFPALNFASPAVGATASALDGNAASSRQMFVNVPLEGLSLPPGHELFLRWLDLNDPGNDHGLAVDDLTVLFGEAAGNAPYVLAQPESRTVSPGDTVTFTVSAGGTPPLAYQWQFNSQDLAGATNASLVLSPVTFEHAGDYRVTITNALGWTNSLPATLTVLPASAGLSVLQYNVRGFGATDWSTNSLQIQAIARQLQFLEPDIITFNEIPFGLRWQMTNFAAAFLPAYGMAISSGTDGSICSAIASRHPITRSNSWLARMDLRGFGYTNENDNLDNFTRDLFEVELAVPGFPQPLHVFTTHLKATDSGANYADNAAKRAAEAAAITNFLATNLLSAHPLRPFVLAGDMNESDTTALAIQTLISPATGLVLTNPRNPVTGSINTFSTTTANPGSRLDYIFPSALLAANIRTSQVFRTDRLSPLPPNLNSNDCKVASDHLPVMVVFNHPYAQAFRLLSLTRDDLDVTLAWESVPGQAYRVETATNLAAWSTLAGNLLATQATFVFTTNLDGVARFFRVARGP
jgi:endonuclease/exonuclease/phosphatase family metal-dependent hydrolase